MADLLPIFMFATLVLCLFSGYPVGLVLGGVGLLFGFIGILAGDFLPVQFYAIVPRMFTTAGANLLLVAVPMFIFMGIMLEKTGVAADLLTTLQRLLRVFPGGLSLAVIALGTVLAAMTGIIGASVVMITMLALPTMLERGYSPSLATGTIAASGTLGILIPPSIMLVVMADLMGASVGKLFLAAIVPGLILASLYGIFVIGYAAVRPDAAPRPPADDRLGGPQMLALVARSLVPPVFLIGLVLGSIFFGWATVTEASGIGAAGSIVLAAAYRQLSFRLMNDVLDRTLRTVGMVFMIILGATTFSFVFRSLGGDDLVRELIQNLDLNRWIILSIFMMVIFVLGFFFDWTEIVLIALPVILPALMILDFSDHVGGSRDVVVWFAMLIAINLQTSFLTPPFGFALFYLKGAAPDAIGVDQIYWGVIPFVLLQLVGLAVVMAYPQLALWLPDRIL